MRYQGYYISGRRGSYHQLLINGVAYYYDSVRGDGDGTAINKQVARLGDAIHYEVSPLFGDFNAEQMAEYVGA
jgi:hypothetical protein